MTVSYSCQTSSIYGRNIVFKSGSCVNLKTMFQIYQILVVWVYEIPKPRRSDELGQTDPRKRRDISRHKLRCNPQGDRIVERP